MGRSTASQLRPKIGSTILAARTQVSRNLSRRLPYYLTPEEAHLIIDAAGSTRNHLFLQLLWETGVRVSEAIALRLGDVGPSGIRVFGKGSVERVVFIQDGLASAILFYAQEGGKEGHSRPQFIRPANTVPNQDTI